MERPGDSKRRSISRKLRSAMGVCGVIAALSTGLLSGCTRHQYRFKTDREAYYLLDEKVGQSCETGVRPYRIEIDARSRMFDPFNPDRPPMPEDDPQANRFMRLVDGKKGYPLWEGNGRTNIVENPEWWNYLPLDERGVLVLDLNDAVRTALLHSPAYQSALEEMYLSALDVSSERFLLDSQFFGGWQSTYTADGPRRNNGTDSSGLLTTGPASRGRRPFSMQKRFATGADLVVGLANSLTWQLAGPNDQSSSTVLDFALVQPLLRQGGRDVVLERLTLAERTLLANVRAFERFRRSFYMQVATGRNIDTRPQRRGGIFGGAGFGGFTGLGGGFGTLGGGGGGVGGLGGGAVPGANGYLGLLQDQLQISNQQETVAQLTDVLLQLRDNYRELLLTIPESQNEIPSQQLQVAQAQQDLFNFQTSLLQLQVAYEQTLDGFKATLGLPPYLCVEIRDPLLDRFKLVSQDLRDRRAELALFRASVGDDNSHILDLSRVDRDPDTGEAFRAIAASPQLAEALAALRSELQPLQRLQRKIVEQDIPNIRADVELLRQAVPTRRRQLNRLLEISNREKGMVCSLLPTGTLNTSFLNGDGLEELPVELSKELDRFEAKFKKQQEVFDRLASTIGNVLSNLDQFADDRARFSEISESVILGAQDLIALLSEDVLAIQLIQARSRTEAALLPEIDIEPRDALEIARNSRRDWLNNRAALVNSWRAIEVVADDLESFLDLTFSGDVQNVGDNPLALRAATGRLRVGLTWDAPITRLQERNNYRQVLIEYQRSKRSYYQFEDGVWTTMRSTLRTIRQNQLSFEIQRYAVQTAAEQISINEDLRQINETLGQVSGPTAARDAVTALNALLATQSQLIGIYVNYEALRRNLDLDLGTMQVDAEGLWVDPGPIRADTLGGSLGEAILEYGLSEREMQLRDQLQMIEDQPIEVAPSDQLPPATVTEESAVGTPPVVDAPALAPAVDDGASGLPPNLPASPLADSDLSHRRSGSQAELSLGSPPAASPTRMTSILTKPQLPRAEGVPQAMPMAGDAAQQAVTSRRSLQAQPPATSLKMTIPTPKASRPQNPLNLFNLPEVP